MSDDTVDEALEERKRAWVALLERGLWVLPVKKGEKRPDSVFVPNGFLDGTKITDMALGWLEAKPSLNVGVCCGPDFGIVVLDVDVKNGARGLETLAGLWLNAPKTLTAVTPSGGYHLYFKHPGVPLIAKLDGIDIKGADGGGYVLAPPSVLSEQFAAASGTIAGAYDWVDPAAPIADFPRELLAELRTDKARKGTEKPQATSTPQSMAGPVASIKTPQGARHDRLKELGAIYRGKGLAAPEIEALLWWHATENFAPPFSRDLDADVREVDAIVHWYEGKEPNGTAVSPLPILTTAELRERAKAAPEKALLDPPLPEAGSMMIYGAAGIGKSHIGLCVAGALALGRPFLDWTPTGAVSVLYVDGEMPLDELDARIASYFGDDPLERLTWIAARACEADLPNLADPAAQEMYFAAAVAAAAQVVVFDNLTCLRSTSAELPENSLEAWHPVANFIRRLNRRGIAVVVIHHASKAGQQRGSTAHVAPMDTVLCIRALAEGQADPLAENDVEFVFDKHRRFGGEAAQPFRAKAIGDPDGNVIWERVGPDPLVDDVVRLRREGMSIRKIATALKRSRKGVEKAITRAKGRGLLPLGGSDE